MTPQEFWDSGISFLHICVVYYAIQLFRCALLSLIVFAFVFTLRKTALKNKIFLKGALWSLFLPVLLIGKMKFFYESRIGRKLFSWLTEICMDYIWVCWLYLCGIFLYAAMLFYRKNKLSKIVVGMEKRNVDSTSIYVTKAPVTPSAIGAFRPKIVIPEIVLEKYSKEELHTILLHEKTHIRLGHLLFYLLWDILRALLWLNPFLTIGTKYLWEDMEDICDLVTIQKSGGNAYEYGQLLLKSIKLLQTENESFPIVVTFIGGREYQNIRKRIKRIAGYQPYRRATAASTLIIVFSWMAAATLWTQNASYGRCNPIDSIVVYDMGTGTELAGDSEALRKAVNYDENYIYINAEIFQELIGESTVSKGNICFYCSGYYKLPGIGVGGGCGYLETADSENGILKIKFIKQIDIFGHILKML